MTIIDIARPQDKDVYSVDGMLQRIGLKPESKYILLMPFTNFEPRNLPSETIRAFIDKAERVYNMPVIIAGPSRKQTESEGLSRYTLTGATSIPELVEIVRRAEVLVTADSGQMHVAGAVGTDCVALFTKELPSRWAPKRNCIPIYLNVPCSPCSDRQAVTCPHLKCMRGITVDMILQACDKFLLRNV